MTFAKSAAGLFEAPPRSVAGGGASEALGQLAILAGKAGGEVRLVATDFPAGRIRGSLRTSGRLWSSGGCEDSPRQD